MKDTRKKIVLFIVEGKSEEAALAPILSKIIASSVVKFKVLHGDITSDLYSQPKKKMIDKIKVHVKKFMGSIFRSEDILEIIHIVDLDGAYIPDSSVVHKDLKSVLYHDATIETGHVDQILKRNAFKTSNMNALVETESVRIGQGKNGIIPYSIYYMSCNLDHVIHNERNLQPRLKKQSAIDFADKYDGKEFEFYSFLSTDEILKAHSFVDSWRYIQNKHMSLSRCSNLALYLEKYFR